MCYREISNILLKLMCHKEFKSEVLFSIYIYIPLSIKKINNLKDYLITHVS